MADGNTSDSPLEAVAAGTHATEAFELLGNETRLAILVALWESYEPFDDDNAVSFSELRSRVGTADSGQFNYHLDRLDGHFIESVDGGYELREAGLKFVRSVVAGAGIEEPTLEPTEIDMTCKLCGGSVEVLYEDGWVYNRCTECDGLWDEGGEGHLSKLSLDPAGLTNRSPAEVYAAAWTQGFNDLYNMLEGVCGSCSGPVERALEICGHHDEEGVCGSCGRRRRIVARFRCTVCKEVGQASPGTAARYHPAVVAFYYDHGVPLQYGSNDLAHINRRLETGGTEVAVVTEDPPAVRVTIELDGDEVWLELDENLAVVDEGP